MKPEDLCGTPVIQAKVRPGMTVNELVEQYGNTRAYNAGSLWRAVNIYENMLRDKDAVKFFGLAGAMVPGGMGGIVSDLIDRGHIDILVSTGANLTHDTIEAIGCKHYHGTEICDDVLLREEEINRIYDIFLPNDAFIKFESFLQEVFESLEKSQKYSIQDITHLIGEHLNTGILAEAAKKDIPVFCPALQDSMIGLQYWLFNQTRGITVDAFKDMSKLIDRCFAAKKAGAMLVGGGVPKNYIFQSMLMTPNGFDYAVQLTGDRPDLGGLSGATLDEAKSWGKLTGEAKGQTVYGDATINLPLIVAAVLERLED
ncbi:deoxyhypusine synthase [Methanomicrobium sp. W14]|uniref:deoxyhypusine synthase n=1 Tax=Methanomicrobium sp. W14 TaxID=2817839 RepID=UPI001AE11D73|nr:deoxyhypusine synthase [Methanomicrobium sp. W14]MBP2133429.1 deoxyhypusine synthase [Methanomicrobium sp. W14]